MREKNPKNSTASGAAVKKFHLKEKQTKTVCYTTLNVDAQRNILNVKT
jgi:hypothetical protein